MANTVAVVGAGLAGLTCAQTLQSAGLEVVVLEKSRGPGGRLSTRRTDAAQYDHGAQYFTVRHARFAAFIEQRVQDGSVAVWQPRLSSPARHPDEPWYVGSPGMSALGRAQAKGLDVRVEQRVASLKRIADRWQLFMEDGSVLEGFDAVVVAVPNAQAVPLLREHAPQWADDLSGTPMQPCWTVMLSTQEALTDIDADTPANGPIGWWARNSSKPGRVVTDDRHDWVLQASAQWTQEHLEDDKAAVALTLVEAFGVLTASSVQPLQAPMAHRWLYARRTPGLMAFAEPWWLPNMGLGVCGDGLGHSRVEQAYLSGLGLGQAIIENNKGMRNEC